MDALKAARAIDNYGRTLDSANGAELFVREFDQHSLHTRATNVPIATSADLLSERQAMDRLGELEKKSGWDIAKCAINNMGQKRGVWDTVKCDA
ncbi:unnamed protein product [Sympodiomycopsis kandeliae]